MPTLFAAGRIPARTLTHRLMNTTSTLRSPATVPFFVTRKGREYDTVYFNPAMTSAEVRRSLIEFDGYPVDIEVRRDA